MSLNQENLEMPFSSYKSISAVAKEYIIKYVRKDFIVETDFTISQTFRDEVDLTFNVNSNIFTQNKTFYTIQELERLFAAINYIFKECELQLDNITQQL